MEIGIIDTIKYILNVIMMSYIVFQILVAVALSKWIREDVYLIYQCIRKVFKLIKFNLLYHLV